MAGGVLTGAGAGLPFYLEDLGHGVHAVDTGFQRERLDAAYLLVHEGRAAFIDTGPGSAVPRLLGALEALGIARDAVDWVIPTHVHLDHAAGAGLLMSELPAARMLVHPRGARHMIDPRALWQGALAVYGPEEMQRSYGQPPLGVAPGRVVESRDGMTISLAGRELLVIDTPGHARHHHCLWDEATRGWFTGDTFGISLREFDNERGAWILPSIVPTQFEPEPLRESMRRLLAAGPECIYLTHFGHVRGAREVQRLGAFALERLDDLVALGERLRGVPERHEALRQGILDLSLRSLAAHGCTFTRERTAELLAIDMELGAQGLAIWLDR